MIKPLLFGISLAGAVLASSLYDLSDHSSGIYAGRRDFRIGDVITIFISEATSAVQEAGTQTSGRSIVDAQFDSVWNQLAMNNGNDERLQQRREYGIGGGSQYDGVGQTTRKSSVKAVMSGVVTRIFDNGNLYIVGEHRIKVNEETEMIQISGILRPDYINDQNAVFSYQIADLQITLQGDGVVADKQTPGFFSRITSWLF